MDRRLWGWWSAIVIAIGLPTFLVFRTDLYFDDFYFLNHLRSGMDSWADLLLPQPGFHYRPLSIYVYFAVGHAVSGLAPFGYQLLLWMSILLGGAAVYVFLRTRSFDGSRALGASLLFLVSLYWLPNATWFSYFQHTLYLVLFLTGFSLWLRAFDSGGHGHAIGGLTLLLLSFFANQVALIFSVLWLLYPAGWLWRVGERMRRRQAVYLLALLAVQLALAVVFVETTDFAALGDPDSPYFQSYTFGTLWKSIRYYHLDAAFILGSILAWRRMRRGKGARISRGTLLDLYLGLAMTAVGFAPFAFLCCRLEESFLGLFFVGFLLVLLTLSRSWPRRRVHYLLAGIFGAMLIGYADYDHLIREPRGASARQILHDFRASPMRTTALQVRGFQNLDRPDRLYPDIWLAMFRLANPDIREAVLGDSFVWPGESPSEAFALGRFDAYAFRSRSELVRDCDLGVGCEP